MKKLMFLIGFVIIGGFAFSVDLSYGIRGAAGLMPGSESNFLDENGKDGASPGFTANVGAYLSVNLFPWLSLHSEINVAFMVFSYSIIDETRKTKSKINDSWQDFEVPILVKFGIPAGKLRFRLLAGPNFAFSVAKLKSSVEKEEFDLEESSSYTETMPVGNKIRIGWIGGIEMVVAFSEDFDFGVDLRYVASPEEITYFTHSNELRDITKSQTHRVLLSLAAGWRI
ncbi:MAG: hypothetical protein IIW10_03695 [Spirochaetaceae bacterium]|nr:hypothetical protein [Spirochaetaceae bacterium]